jgi:hypothetical protein
MRLGTVMLCYVTPKERICPHVSPGIPRVVIALGIHIATSEREVTTS